MLPAKIQSRGDLVRRDLQFDVPDRVSQAPIHGNGLGIHKERWYPLLLQMFPGPIGLRQELKGLDRDE